jgi:hypothetical protein
LYLVEKTEPNLHRTEQVNWNKTERCLWTAVSHVTRGSIHPPFYWPIIIQQYNADPPTLMYRLVWWKESGRKKNYANQCMNLD